jgi:hypothetical protein
MPQPRVWENRTVGIIEPVEFENNRLKLETSGKKLNILEEYLKLTKKNQII